MYDESYAVYNREKDPIYDKAEIYEVIDKMLVAYEEKEGFSETIWTGIDFLILQNLIIISLKQAIYILLVKYFKFI